MRTTLWILITMLAIGSWSLKHDDTKGYASEHPIPKEGISALDIYQDKGKHLPDYICHQFPTINLNILTLCFQERCLKKLIKSTELRLQKKPMTKQNDYFGMWTIKTCPIKVMVVAFDYFAIN
ncbi:uncharacterized protein LOC125757983 [Rhipicephalus sanguineus]|uniref:uncharacterized protein LOC125757983 n=1 Tax=Rhipicephalus sanguineus TaxID=34632 RepID=UPI0020C37D81|nr:uncharacterized protein LOC125757983 [Rhipicephalus sanguineus]